MLETTLTGEIIGEPLKVIDATQAQGVYFVPETQEMFVTGEPHDVVVFRPKSSNSTATQPGSAAVTASTMMGTAMFVIVNVFTMFALW